VTWEKFFVCFFFLLFLNDDVVCVCGVVLSGALMWRINDHLNESYENVQKKMKIFWVDEEIKKKWWGIGKRNDEENYKICN